MIPTSAKPVPFIASNIGAGEAICSIVKLLWLGLELPELAALTSLTVHLQQIKNEVTIDTMDGLLNLSFPLLKTISTNGLGLLAIRGCENLQNVYLRQLVSYPAGRLTFEAGVASTPCRVRHIYLDSLAAAPNGLSFSDANTPNLISVSLLALATVTGDLVLTNIPVTAASFPALTSVSHAIDVSETALQSFSAPLLTSVGSGGITAVDDDGLGSFVAPLLATIGGKLDLANTGLGTLSLPALTSIGGLFRLTNQISTLSLPLLASIGGVFEMQNSFGLETLSLPTLHTIGGTMNISFCESLTSLSLPGLTSAGDILAQDCALDEASVNALLRKLVLIGWGPAAKTCYLADGTSASPTGQGLTDKATLEGRGATIVVN